MKPLHKILIVTGIVLLGAFLIYFGWKKISPPPPSKKEKDITLPVPPRDSERKRGLPSFPEDSQTAPQIAISSSKLKKISEEEVFDFWVMPTTGEVFYFTPLGKVFSAKEGPDLEISTQSTTALNSIEISPDGEKALVAFGNPLAPSWGIFDFIDKVWRPLPAEIQNAAWGMQNKVLFAIIKNESNKLSLVEVNLSETPPVYKKYIEDFRLRDIKLAFQPPNALLILEKPSAFYAGRLWSLDLKTLSFNSLFLPEKGLIFNRLIDDESTALKFASPNNFFILGKNLENLVPLTFSTLPSKCSRNQPLYCFAPINIPANSTLPDDYFKRQFLSIDSLYLIDTFFGDTIHIFQSNKEGFPAIDGEHPTYSRGNLYFKNRFDNSLYQLEVGDIQELLPPIGD